MGWKRKAVRGSYAQGVVVEGDMGRDWRANQPYVRKNEK